MARAYDDFDDQYRQAGLLSKIGLALFVGLPATIVLAVALAVYCTVQVVADSLFPRPKGLKLNSQSGPAQSEEAFTASLAKMAEVHSPAVQVVDAPKQHASELASTEQTRKLS